MARLASNEKMGYYPTPEKSLKFITQYLKSSKKVYCLDPCCGEGYALEQIKWNLVRAETYGIELDPERAEKASYSIQKVIQGSIFDAKITPGSFGLLYLNPPYDSDNGERVEIKFLKHSHKWLAPGGVLVFIVPEHIFEKQEYREWIGQHYKNIKIYRLHRDDFPQFKQVVLFGYKRASRSETGEVIPLPPYPHIEDIEIEPYIIPAITAPQEFKMKETVTEEEILTYRPKMIAELERIKGKFESVNYLTPLFPLRKGHLVTLLTAGALDGKINTPEGYLVVKGFAERVQHTREEDDKLITTDTYHVCVRVIEMSNGKAKWYDIK
jgi:SAM-dependent methyltransferase